jgi:hypothetical protein
MASEGISLAPDEAREIARQFYARGRWYELADALMLAAAETAAREPGDPMYPPRVKITVSVT